MPTPTIDGICVGLEKESGFKKELELLNLDTKTYFDKLLQQSYVIPATRGLRSLKLYGVNYREETLG
jgi:hypothetical protein